MGWPRDRTPDVVDLSNLDKKHLSELLESDFIEFESLSSGTGRFEVNVKPIRISTNVFCWIKGLLDNIIDVEFSAMLELRDDGLISDIYFPEQTGKSSTYDIHDHDSCRGYDGFLHSHPWSANPTFSGTDKEGHVSNYDVSVLVGRDEDSKLGVGTNAFRRISIESGLVRCPANVRIDWTAGSELTFSPERLSDILDERFNRDNPPGWNNNKNRSPKGKSGKSGSNRSNGNLGKTRDMFRGRPRPLHDRAPYPRDVRAENKQNLPPEIAPGIGEETIHRDADYDDFEEGRVP